MSNIALEAKTKEHKLLKSYLEANASECLIEKINNGVKIEKDGKTLINKKTLETFMAFAKRRGPITFLRVIGFPFHIGFGSVPTYFSRM